MEIVVPPHVERREAQPYLGIRVVTPFRGMLKVRNDLQAELDRWARARYVATRGFGLFRLHVIDMDGPMDIEVGVLVDGACEPDGRVHPGVLPAGEYATCTFREEYLTDPRTEPRRTRWDVELAIKLA